MSLNQSICSLTVSEYLQNWLDKVIRDNVKRGTFTSYATTVKKRIVPYLGQKLLAKLCPKDIDTWLRSLTSAGFAHSTLTQTKAVLSTALRYAVYPAELISSNPCGTIAIPRTAPRHVIKRTIVTENLLKEIQQHYPIGHKYHLPLLLAYHTGMRISEILGLDWQAVDIARGCLTVKKQLLWDSISGSYYFDTPKSEAGCRTILLDSRILREIQVWQRIQKQREQAGGNWLNIDLVCTDCHGRPLRYASLERSLQKRFGLNTHSFRHTHATKLIEGGASPIDVAARLGHSSAELVNNVYTHDTENMQRTTLAIWDKVLGNDNIIGNNIANVNTTGFKSSRVTFADTLNQTLSGASAPTGNKGGVNAKQVGLGSAVASIDVLFNDGSVQSTGKNTDLCISGNGLFVVNDGKQTYYTRNGAFEFDGSGNYVIPSSGLKVQGWMADDSGSLSTTGPTTDIVVKLGTTMEAKLTSTVSYENNLNANVPIITSYSFVKPSDGTTHTETTAGKYIGASTDQPVTLYFSDNSKLTVNSGRYVIGRSVPQTTAWTYYDSLGVEHTSTVLFEKSTVGNVTYTDDDGNPVTKKATAWVMSMPEQTVNEPDGSTSTYTLGSTTITFDYDGIIREGTFSGTEALTPDTNSDVTITTPPGALEGSSVKKSSLSVTHTAPNGSSTPQSISLDLSGLTQYADMNTIYGSADGNAAGSLESIAIDSSGTIIGTYTNNINKAEAQVAIAQFTNASGLTKTGSSLYQVSNNSGTPNVKSATDLGVKITPSSLEMSNVDIANEFSDMIITQRGFQSNSKIITVGDEMIETVINMKR